MTELEGMTKDGKYKVKYDRFRQSYEIIIIRSNKVVRRWKCFVWAKIVAHYKTLDIAVQQTMRTKGK